MEPSLSVVVYFWIKLNTLFTKSGKGDLMCIAEDRNRGWSWGQTRVPAPYSQKRDQGQYTARCYQCNYVHLVCSIKGVSLYRRWKLDCWYLYTYIISVYQKRLVEETKVPLRSDSHFPFENPRRHAAVHGLSNTRSANSAADARGKLPIGGNSWFVASIREIHLRSPGRSSMCHEQPPRAKLLP